MKWIHDSGLIVCQIITWSILIFMWGIVFAVMYFLPGGFSTIGIILIAALLFVQYFFSDKLVMRLMGARVIEEHENPRLYNTIKKLANTAELPMPKVAIANSPMPNAFATGRNRSHSVVAVTTALLPILSQDELEAVLAHELSHIKNYDMATMTIAGFLAAIASSLMISQAFTFFRTRKQGLAEVLIGLIMILIIAVLFVLTLFLTRLLSRYRELAADRGSALITSNPDAMIRALNKISSGVSYTSSSAGVPLAASNNLYYIIPAARGMSLFGLFSTHPSLKRRIKNLEKTKNDMISGRIALRP